MNIESRLVAALKAIREQANAVLQQIEDSGPQRSLAWKCKGCGYSKHFTRPITREVAARCPRCKGDVFEPA